MSTANHLSSQYHYEDLHPMPFFLFSEPTTNQTVWDAIGTDKLLAGVV